MNNQGTAHPMREQIFFSAGFGKYTRLCAMLDLMVASALMTSRPSHAESDYERTIRSEGHKLEPINRNPAAADENTDKLVKDFEEALLKNFPNNYRMYQQLTPEKRRAVFKLYLENRDFKIVRRRIIDLRFGS